jgi:hypothetical protein
VLHTKSEGFTLPLWSFTDYADMFAKEPIQEFVIMQKLVPSPFERLDDVDSESASVKHKQSKMASVDENGLKRDTSSVWILRSSRAECQAHLLNYTHRQRLTATRSSTCRPKSSRIFFYFFCAEMSQTKSFLYSSRRGFGVCIRPPWHMING